MVLTNKQKEELNKAILEYLHSNNFTKSAENFEVEAQVQFDPSSKKSGVSDILEKKWISIIRLQKKIHEHESKIEQITSELNSSSKYNKNMSSEEKEDLLPKAPAKFTLTGHRSVVTHLAFHPEFSQVASCSEDASIKLWDFETGTFEKSMKGHTGTVNYISFDNAGKYIASASSDLTIKLWDLIHFACVKTFYGHEHSISSVEFLPGGDFIISASRDKTIRLWEIATGFNKKTFQGHDDWVRRAVVNASGTLIASCSNDQSAILWKIDNTNPYLHMREHEHVIEAISFINHENGKKCILESNYGKGMLSGFKDDEESKFSEKDINKKIQFNIEKQQQQKNYDQYDFIVTGSRDKSIKIWNCSNGNNLITLIGHDNWVRGLSVHHSGKYLYSCSDDKSFRVWDLKTGKTLRKIQDAHSHFVTSVVASNKYLVIATASVEANVKIWECKF